MAYGIISIITYLIFLIWVMATSDQGYDNGPYKPFGSGAASMAAAMGQAFSIQSFFIPVLKKNKNPKKYVFYTMLAYIFGALAYYYIAYMGSFGNFFIMQVFYTDNIHHRAVLKRLLKGISERGPGRSILLRESILFIFIQSFLNLCSSVKKDCLEC